MWPMLCSSQSKLGVEKSARSLGESGMVSPTGQNHSELWLSSHAPCPRKEGSESLRADVCGSLASLSTIPVKGATLVIGGPELLVRNECSYIAAILQLLAQFNYGSSGAAFLVGGLLDAGYVGVGAQVFAQGAAQDAHA